MGLTGRFEIAGAPLKVGFVAQNFGPGMKYKNVTDPLPTTYKLGAAAGVSGKWLLSAELAAPRGNSPYLCAGAEHTAYSSDNLTVALRTGLSSLTLSGLSGLNGLSAGMGLGFSRVSVDYSVVLFGELGMAHRLSMTLKLGADKAPSRQAARGETEPKHRMALVFRWYLAHASRWANAGEPTRQLDYQVWCGPAMGAFNEWTKGSFLERVQERRAGTVALNLLVGAAALWRLDAARRQGAALPAGLDDLSPKTLTELEACLEKP